MKANGNPVARYTAVLLLIPALLMAGCEQRNKQQNAQAGKSQVTQEQVTGGRVRLRQVCADDIQKYCANADRKRRCLRDNIDKLSDACKTALAQRGGGRRARGNNGGDD